MTERYEFRIAGWLSADLLRTFEPIEVDRDHGDTVFVRTVLDDGELFGVISRCETLRLHLVGLRKLTTAPPTTLPG